MFVCTVISCVRQAVGPKKAAQYEIEEKCRYAMNGTCTYKRHEKMERRNGNPEPGK